jgi:hypothetical protein
LRANFRPRAANASDAVRPPAGRREIFRRSFDPSLQRRLSHIRTARNAQSSIDQRVPSVIWRRAGDRRADLELPPRGDCRRIRPKIGDRIEAKSLLCPISPVAPVTRAACDRCVRAHRGLGTELLARNCYTGAPIALASRHIHPPVPTGVGGGRGSGPGPEADRSRDRGRAESGRESGPGAGSGQESGPGATRRRGAGASPGTGGSQPGNRAA